MITHLKNMAAHTERKRGRPKQDIPLVQCYVKDSRRICTTCFALKRPGLSGQCRLLSEMRWLNISGLRISIARSHIRLKRKSANSCARISIFYEEAEGQSAAAPHSRRAWNRQRGSAHSRSRVLYRRICRALRLGNGSLFLSTSSALSGSLVFQRTYAGIVSTLALPS